MEQIRKRICYSQNSNNTPRQYEKLPETAYGDQAQADFGSFHMLSKDGGRRKVHFLSCY